jgi:GntR family transcriptional regulator
MRQAAQIRIDPASAIPVVRQIVDSIRVLLVDGQLQPGAVLPSIRRMAIELGVHFNTVAEAYRELAAEGWLDLQQGRGARVIERQIPSITRSEITDFQGRLRQMAAQMQARGMTPIRIAAELRAVAEGLSK